jgi:hypothetical protein
MATKEAIETALRQFEESLLNNQVDLTLGEYIKLLQLAHEIEDDEPKEITVQWIETPSGSSVE